MGNMLRWSADGCNLHGSNPWSYFRYTDSGLVHTPVAGYGGEEDAVKKGLERKLREKYW